MPRGISDPKSTSQGSQNSQKNSESGTKPTKFEELMRRMTSTRQFPIDLQPISPMPPSRSKPGPVNQPEAENPSVQEQIEAMTPGQRRRLSGGSDF